MTTFAGTATFDGIKGQYADRRARPSRKREAGRVCQYPNCDTVLSVYNLSETCSPHSTYRPRIPGRPNSPEAIAAIRQRNEEIRALVVLGMPREEAARRYGISGTRVGQIVHGD